MTALLFPVGHYLGRHYRVGDGEPAGHRVRLGSGLRWLCSEPELLAWTLAHGLGELAGGERPTRDVLTAQARQLAGLDITGAVSQLVERRLLVEIDPTGGEAAGFAASHRLGALLLTLGPDPDDPDAVLLGAAGQPAVALSEFGHTVWLAAQRSPTLWAACHAVAGTAGADGDGTGAARLLPELLGELHELLSAGAAYLDAAEGVSR